MVSPAAAQSSVSVQSEHRKLSGVMKFNVCLRNLSTVLEYCEGRKHHCFG